MKTKNETAAEPPGLPDFRDRRKGPTAMSLPHAQEAGLSSSVLFGDGSGSRPVLDACCGSRMFWFDRADPRAVFVDKRCETHELPDVSSKGGKRTLSIAPDLVADFTALPFADESFALVSFDPPHFERNGAKGWVGLKYGTLTGDWKEMLSKGFAECFRVLKPEGVLVLKWCADEIPVSQILALTPQKPLFGNRCGKNAKTHWVVFMKPNAKLRDAASAIAKEGTLRAPIAPQAKEGINQTLPPPKKPVLDS